MIVDTQEMTERQWDTIKRALTETLTGGNHLASVLIGRLGCDARDFPHYDSPMDVNEAQEKNILVGDNWDLWVCWRSIMRLREALRKAGLYE